MTRKSSQQEASGRGVEEARARELVAVRSGGMCEICGREPATDWHHRKPRSQGGPWTADNGFHLCRVDHAWVTENPAACYALGWLVRRRDEPAGTPVLRRGRKVYLQPDGSMTAADGVNFPLR